MKIGVSLVIYNNDLDDLSKVIRSLKNIELAYRVVIDNSSNDRLKKLFESNEWIYIFNPVNNGFGAAHNIAIKRYQQNADYHLVVNPDVEFDGLKVLSALTKFMDKKKDCGMVMPKIIYPTGEDQQLSKLLPSPFGWFARRFLKGSKILKKYNTTFLLSNIFSSELIYKAPYLSGCFLLIRVSDLQKIGGFDEKIFMYGEDTDISRRFWINKRYPYYYGKVSVSHKFEKGSHKSIKLLIIALKSTIYYFNKWGWLDKQRKTINAECLSQEIS